MALEPDQARVRLASTRRDEDDEIVVIIRMGSVDAREMATELVRLAATIEAPNN